MAVSSWSRYREFIVIPFPTRQRAVSMVPMDVLKTPFMSVEPAMQLAPVVLTSPHSGRCYPDAFLAASRLDPVAIRRSEDSFVEELYASAPRLGLPLLAANFPRAFCDVNREAWELDPTMFEDRLPHYANTASPRVSAGLGTIARIVGTGEPIYRRKLKFAEAQERIICCWQPYHDELQRLIDVTIQQFGVCLLLDCHSMPSMPFQRGGGRLADVILGDVHGTSCTPVVAGFVDTRLSRLGLRVRRNDPYAGGYITRHYGRPRDGVHALQIELSRALYMDEAAFQKTDHFARLTGQMHDFMGGLIEAADALLPSRRLPLAPAAE